MKPQYCVFISDNHFFPSRSHAAQMHIKEIQANVICLIELFYRNYLGTCNNVDANGRLKNVAKYSPVQATLCANLETKPNGSVI